MLKLLNLLKLSFLEISFNSEDELKTLMFLSFKLFKHFFFIFIKLTLFHRSYNCHSYDHKINTAGFSRYQLLYALVQ